MAQLFTVKADARRVVKSLLVTVIGLAILTIFASGRVYAQAEGAPTVTGTGQAESPRQSRPPRVEEAPYPGGPGRRVEEAPYPGGPGRRVEEAPYPGTVGGPGDLQRLKRLPGESESVGPSVDPAAR